VEQRKLGFLSSSNQSSDPRGSEATRTDRLPTRTGDGFTDILQAKCFVQLFCALFVFEFFGQFKIGSEVASKMLVKFTTFYGMKYQKAVPFLDLICICQWFSFFENAVVIAAGKIQF